MNPKPGELPEKTMLMVKRALMFALDLETVLQHDKTSDTEDYTTIDYGTHKRYDYSVPTGTSSAPSTSR